MRIMTVIDYDMNQNTFIVCNLGDAFVIDPGADSEKIIAKAKEHNIDITDILLTHGHIDHIRSVNELRSATKAKVWASKNTNRMIQDKVQNLSVMFKTPMEVAPADNIIEDMNIYTICGIDVQALSTPGHTDGCTCYYIKSEGIVFSGDTLFHRSVGRTDLPTGDSALLTSSVKNVLYSLDDDTKVYPGHGDETTIGYEKRFNFFISE